MVHIGKRRKAAEALVDHVREAVVIVKNEKSKFDETVLGVNPKHADQMVRGAIVLPTAPGKSYAFWCSPRATKSVRPSLRAPLGRSDELVQKGARRTSTAP